MPIKQIDDRYLIPGAGTIFRRYVPEVYSLDFLNTLELHLTKVRTFPKMDEVMFSIHDKQYIRSEWKASGKPNWEQEAEDAIINYESFKDYTYINCWNNDKHELRSLWNDYAPDNGLCFKTSYEKLMDSLNTSPEEMQVSKVFYFDGVSDSIGIYNTVRFFCRKLSDFRRENESRIIIQLPLRSINPDFKRVKVDINKTLDSIILSPRRTDEFKLKVESALNMNNISVPLVESSMRPSYVV